MDVTAVESNTKYEVGVARADGPLSLNQSMAGYNTTDFIWFRVDISQLAAESDTIKLTITEYHKRRREAFPEKLSLLDEQTIRF